MSQQDELKVEVAQAPSLLRRCAAQSKKMAGEVLNFMVYLSFAKSWVGLGWVFLVALVTCWRPVYQYARWAVAGGFRMFKRNVQYLPWIACGFVIVEKIYDYGLTDLQRGQVTALATTSFSGFQNYIFGFNLTQSGENHHRGESWKYMAEVLPSGLWFTGTLARRIFDQTMLALVETCGLEKPAASPFCQEWMDLAEGCKHKQCTRDVFSAKNQQLKYLHHFVWWMAHFVAGFCYYMLFYALSSTLHHAWAMRNVRTIETFTAEGFTISSLEPTPIMIRASANSSAYRQYFQVKGTKVLVPVGGPSALQVLSGSRQEEMALPESKISKRGTIHAGIITFQRKDGSVLGNAYRSGDLVFTAFHVWKQCLLEGDIDVVNAASKRVIALAAQKWEIEVLGKDAVGLKPQRGLFEQLAVKSMKHQLHPDTGIHKIEWLSRDGPLGSIGMLLNEWQNDERLHTISTLGGSSGAPITNKRDEVVAIHVASRSSLGTNSCVEIIDLLLALEATKEAERTEESELPKSKRELKEEQWERRTEPSDDGADYDPDAVYTKRGKIKIRARDAHHIAYMRDNDIERGPRMLSEAALARQEQGFGIGGRARYRTEESDFRILPKTREDSSGKQVGKPKSDPGSSLTKTNTSSNPETKSKQEGSEAANSTNSQAQSPPQVGFILPPYPQEHASKSEGQPSGTASPRNKKKQNGKHKQKPTQASSGKQ